MTLHRERKEIVFECNGCGDTLETGTDDFAEARATLKAERWGTSKVGEDWHHRCPTTACQPPRWWEGL